MKNMLAASLVGITLVCVAPARGADMSKLDARIDAAHDVLHELMATPDKGTSPGHCR